MATRTRFVGHVLLLLLAGVQGHKLVDESLDEAFGHVRSGTESALIAIEESPETPPHFRLMLNSVIDNARPCKRGERFSRADGVCNNLLQPFKGAVLDIERRLFPNGYWDGRQIPREQSVDGSLLPSAREVSQKCFGAQEDSDGVFEERATQLVNHFGQFLTHDISFLVETLASECCEKAENCDTLCVHPDQNNREGGCFPITVPAGDSFFKEKCMVFKRSFGVNVLQVREQVNGLTSFIDASNIYGASKFHQDELRLGVKGLLRTDHGLLPELGNAQCIKRPSLQTCPGAGDVRLHEQPALGAMHVVFHLDHNRIATKLGVINRFWSDDRLFLETRKIMIGIMQKIIYEDYLPVVLGDAVMRQFGLDKPFVLNQNVDPSVILEFSTAAFRFGHSMLNTKLNGDPFSDLFLKPVRDLQHVDDLLVNGAQTLTHKTDNLFTAEMRDWLFKNVSTSQSPVNSPFPGPSFDLTARNIQRGRDHGLPSYPVVRDACREWLKGIPGVLQDPPACLEQGVYRSEEDIDLFVGGVSEKLLDDTLMGPTFACLTALQFHRLKFGDRFFYEGNGVEGFNNEQREFLRRNTMASLICELNPDKSIQRDVFRPANPNNNRVVPCRAILRDRGLDKGLELWGDETQVGRIIRQFSNFDASLPPTGRSSNLGAESRFGDRLRGARRFNFKRNHINRL